MRITNNMITGNLIRNLNTNLTALNRYQMQLATNRRITRLADDPAGVLRSMTIQSKMGRIDQYKRNIDDARTWLAQQELAVSTLNDLAKYAYEQSLQASNGFLTPEDKQAIAEIIGQLRNEVLAVANTKSGDKYIFGGYNTQKAPFTVGVDGKILYNGLDLTDATNPQLIQEDSQVLTYEIGFGFTAQVSIPGTQLLQMGGDDLYTVLDGLYNALQNNATAPEISQYTTRLQNCQSHLLALRAEIGGRSTRLNLVRNRHEETALSYAEAKSLIDDIDQAEVIMHYKMAQATYEAALSVGSRIIQPTLLDFLSR